MSESTFSLITLVIVVFALTATAINKIHFAHLMQTNTHTFTSLGRWLTRMFVAMGLALIIMALIFLFTLLNERGLINYNFRLRQTLRILLIVGSVVGFVSTSLVRRALIPVIKDTEQERKERSWLFQASDDDQCANRAGND